MAKFREIIVKSLDLEAKRYLDSNDVVKGISPLEIYLVPKENGEHDRYVSDGNSFISKQSAGKSGAFFPMAGIDPLTEKVTGALYMSNIGFYDLLWMNGQYRMYKGAMRDNTVDRTEFVYLNPNNEKATVRKSLNWYSDVLSVNSLNSDYSKRSSLQYEYNFMNVDNPYINFNLTKGSPTNYIQTSLNLNTESIAMEISDYYGSKQFKITNQGFFAVGVPDAQGDPTFTRQLVQKEDGSIGYEPKTVGSSNSRPQVRGNFQYDFMDDTISFADGDLIIIEKQYLPNGILKIGPDFNFKSFYLQVLGNPITVTRENLNNTRILRTEDIYTSEGIDPIVLNAGVYLINQRQSSLNLIWITQIQ